MSRSRRRTPVCGITTARSEKQDKVTAHRRELSNVWSYAKDGKQYLGPHTRPEYLRK